MNKSRINLIILVPGAKVPIASHPNYLIQIIRYQMFEIDRVRLFLAARSQFPHFLCGSRAAAGFCRPRQRQETAWTGSAGCRSPARDPNLQSQISHLKNLNSQISNAVSFYRSIDTLQIASNRGIFEENPEVTPVGFRSPKFSI